MSPLLLFIAVAAAPPDTPVPVAASRSARATVRIMQATPIRFGREMRMEASLQRSTTVRERDGSIRPASLIEFY